MLLLVGLTCFSKNENQILKSKSKKLWISTSVLEMRIYKMHFALNAFYICQNLNQTPQLFLRMHFVHRNLR
jgi:hypothetical protein